MNPNTRFEEPGTLAEVALLASDWYRHYVGHVDVAASPPGSHQSWLDACRCGCLDRICADTDVVGRNRTWHLPRTDLRPLAEPACAWSMCAEVRVLGLVVLARGPEHVVAIADRGESL